MKRTLPLMLLGCLMLGLTACGPAEDVSVPAGGAATSSPATPTPTIDWFPASPTPTTPVLPTIQPTPERKPGIGRQLFADDFSEAGFWNPAISEDATISIGDNRMTIAVGPGVNAYRLRQTPTLADFYAEITARPSLCRDADDYGMLFRAPNNVAFYSFALSCNGTARLERVRLGRPYPIHEAIPSADVPAGAPGEVRLGVWVSGSDMRFFLNGRYQFSASDATYASGAIGAFAHSSADTPVTVTFSDLSVYAVSYASPTATPTP